MKLGEMKCPRCGGRMLLKRIVHTKDEVKEIYQCTKCFYEVERVVWLGGKRMPPRPYRPYPPDPFRRGVRFGEG